MFDCFSVVVLTFDTQQEFGEYLLNEEKDEIILYF